MFKMADKEPATVEQESSVVPEFSNFEERLFSLETLDRSSPELWPEKFSGVSEFISLHTPPNNLGSVYSKSFSVEDNNLLHQFASLSTSGLIVKVKELHDVAYQLGVEEAKEMTRGKYLNLFKRSSSRISCI